MNISEVFKNYFKDANISIDYPVVDYASRKVGDYIILVEICKDKGLFGSDLFPLTFLIAHNESGRTQRIDLGYPMSSEDEIKEYLDSITVELINKHYKFGEIKQLNDLC